MYNQEEVIWKKVVLLHVHVKGFSNSFVSSTIRSPGTAESLNIYKIGSMPGCKPVMASSGRGEATRRTYVRVSTSPTPLFAVRLTMTIEAARRRIIEMLAHDGSRQYTILIILMRHTTPTVQRMNNSLLN